MTTNLSADLEVVTSVSKSLLKKFVSPAIYCIGHAVAETLQEKQTITTVDIGIGKLVINIQGDQLLYRFTPSKDLEACLVNTVVSGCSPIAEKLDTTLQGKIEKVYKELL